MRPDRRAGRLWPTDEDARGRPDRPEAVALRGDAAYNAGQLQAARDALQKKRLTPCRATTRPPTPGWGGQPTSAWARTAWLPRSMCWPSRVTGYPDAYYFLGDLDMGQSRWEDAAKQFERAAALRPGHADTHYHLARAYMQLNRPPTRSSSMRPPSRSIPIMSRRGSGWARRTAPAATGRRQLTPTGRRSPAPPTPPPG